ncbi:Sulfotransferase family protein [Pricia antarctica]|uniref:Sulfotransferase family protein n=1 Tax=Pricia antarctica TaxID=641691 RepID=A0A1G6YQZ4_9FLAO|nr:sulfotransferase [Pricia antarctica]SDD92788.1 Sulfotransferase family protein [Pricia antarctica]
MSYSNFKDPFGLFKRMLLSRNTTAYFILFRELLSKILVPVDFLLQGFEKRILKKSRIDSDQPVILILGGSRSGTTLLYQTLAQYLPVSYMNNFIALFHRSPLAALKLFNRFIPNSKRNYESYYGSVAGLDGPNDAFSIWNRWLGDDRNHIIKDISEQKKSEMKSFFNTWMQVSKRPFLNKNNRNSLCAPMLDSVFENVVFIEIYREPIFVAQSLILSRRSVQGSDKIGWGLLSEDSKESKDPLSYIDDICNQVYQVNCILAEGRKTIDTKKYIRVSYEDFCENPADLIQKVSLKALDHKIDFTNLAHLQFSIAANKQRLSDDEFNRIRLCFTKLYTDHKV